MTRLVIDASVIVKWILPQCEEEDTEQALAMLERVRAGEVRVHQPVHWLAEVASVLVRRPVAVPCKICRVCRNLLP